MNTMYDTAASIYKKFENLSLEDEPVMRQAQKGFMNKRNMNSQQEEEYDPMTYVVDVVRKMRKYRESMKQNG